MAPGRLSGGYLHDRVVNLLGHSILQQQFLAGDFLERRLATSLIELLEPIGTVSAIAHELTRLRHVTELLDQFQHADFGFDNFLFCSQRPPSSNDGKNSTNLSLICPMKS